MKRTDLRLPAVFLILSFWSCSDFNPDPKSAVFIDVTQDVHLSFHHEPGVDSMYFMPESIGSGCAFLDYDNDGDLDIYLVNGGKHGQRDTANHEVKNQLFRQEPDGTFMNVTEESGLGDSGYGMGVAVADIDNDGDVDVYVTNYGPDALYKNNGNGTFTNITKAAGIENPNWACSAVFLDYDLDGYLDLFVTNYVDYDPAEKCFDRSGNPDYCGPGYFDGVADMLFHNNGDGTFTDVSAKARLTTSISKGLGGVSTDFNNDHYPDIYVANDGEPNHLWINQKDGTFDERAVILGVAFNALGHAEAGMGVALGDIENDGDFDLFVTHVGAESNTLYRFDTNYGFQDESSQAGLAGPSLPYTSFGTGFFDMDHDGDLDLAVANGRISRGRLLKTDDIGYWDYYAEPNFLFENNGQGKYHLSETDSPFSNLIENSRGLAFGDIDNDGDVDLLVANPGGPARLFRNDSDRKGDWLIVRTFDPQLHRDAIGARVTVVLPKHRLTRIVAPGYSFLSSNDFRAHFGLGWAAGRVEVEVLWPDGLVETFSGIGTNQIVTVEKGQGRKSDE